MLSWDYVTICSIRHTGGIKTEERAVDAHDSTVLDIARDRFNWTFDNVSTLYHWPMVQYCTFRVNAVSAYQ